LIKWKLLKPGNTDASTPDMLRGTLDVMGSGWAAGTHSMYRLGLLLFHVWGNHYTIAEEQWAPVEELLLHTFIGNCVGRYSKAAVENVLPGIHAWHLLHGLH
jgi:hypothetical protein